MLGSHHARFHGAARDKNSGYVQPHGRHEHARGNLVAIGNTDHGVGHMGIDHVFHAVGNELSRRERVKHAVMTHRDSIIDGNRVEFGCKAALLFNDPLYALTDFVQMNVSGDELRERIGDGNHRPAELVLAHTVRAPEAARTRHPAAFGGNCTSELHLFTPVSLLGVS